MKIIAFQMDSAYYRYYRYIYILFCFLFFVFFGDIFFYRRQLEHIIYGVLNPARAPASKTYNKR